MKMRSLVSIISVILSSAYMLVYIVHFITSIAGVICYGYKQSLLALPEGGFLGLCHAFFPNVGEDGVTRQKKK